jgi:hypothetical protein
MGVQNMVKGINVNGQRVELSIPNDTKRDYAIGRFLGLCLTHGLQRAVLYSGAEIIASYNKGKATKIK